MKIRLTVFMFLFALTAVSMLPGCGDGGVPTITSNTTTASSARTADLSGIVYIPASVSGARMAGRVASVVGQDTPLSGAMVRVKRMKSDGSLESIGEEYQATTDSNGQYTIDNVPEEENLIIEAVRQINSGGTSRTLLLKKVISITETDSTSGNKIGQNLNVSTSLCVEAMKDIVIAANLGKSEADKISGTDLPREKIQDIESGLDTALTADQTSVAPVVDIAAVITNGDSAVDTHLTNLENSANGTTVKNIKENASTKGSLRVKVVDLGSAALEEAAVIVTNNGHVQTDASDEQGIAFFDGISPGATIDVEVKKTGYILVKTSRNIEKAAVVYNVTVQMEPTAVNQKPVAKAGPDHSIAQHSSVTLDGSASFDPDGDAITYSWTQTAGTTISLSNAASAQPVFMAATAETLEFSLVVTDSKGSVSQADNVTITVGAVACTIDSVCDDSNPLSLDACSNPGTTVAACTHTDIVCNTNADCNDSNLDTADACVNGGTSSASCTHATIVCHMDTDCADDGIALTIEVCSNGGTSASSCASLSIACATDADCQDDGNPLSIETCANGGTSSASCRSTVIACNSNADCGGAAHVCLLPGTSSSTCIACSADIDCNDNDANTADTCTNPGTSVSSCGHTSLLAPSFGGLEAITSCGTGCLNLTWTAAVDPDGNVPVTYSIYKASNSGAQIFTTPDYTTQNTAYRVAGLVDGNSYFFVVRAKDSQGNEELNTIEISGTPSTLVSISNYLIYQIDGGSANDFLGLYVSSVGDVNGDGVPDFIIGAHVADPGGLTDAGSASVYSGSDGTLLYQKNGESAGDLFGSAVAGAGDVNHDGTPDFIVGAQAANPAAISNAGSTYVFSGVDGSLLYKINGIQVEERFGQSVSTAGDVNNDGHDDVIIGTYCNTGCSLGGSSENGIAYVYDGATGNELYSVAQGGAHFGESVAKVGDVNGDGTPDFIVGASTPGCAHVFSGVDGALLYSKCGIHNLGASVSSAGDVNNDGFTDFLVGGCQAYEGTGLAYVYSGSDGSMIYDIQGQSIGYSFGRAAASGDFNGDGIQDFLIGEAGDAYPDAGSIYAYSGSTGNLIFHMTGGYNFGRSVASIGDINRDGKTDFIVGSFRNDPSGLTDAGSAYILAAP